MSDENDDQEHEHSPETKPVFEEQQEREQERKQEEEFSADGLDSDDDEQSSEQQLETSSAEIAMEPTTPPLHLLLDAGYGVPRESGPRQEKILAIAKQIANFLLWQQKQQEQHSSAAACLSPVTVIGCTDVSMKHALKERLQKLLLLGEELDHKPKDDDNPDKIHVLPPNFAFANSSEEEKELLQDAIYLSPDAPSTLNPSTPPPNKVIVGLLIDRRVQINRSWQRAQLLQLEAKRWPMEYLNDADNNNNDDEEYMDLYHHHAQEPLNVDTILEALQQWSWNCSSSGQEQLMVQDDTPFRNASLQAFRHHAQRHPARPKHRLV